MGEIVMLLYTGVYSDITNNRDGCQNPLYYIVTASTKLTTLYNLNYHIDVIIPFTNHKSYYKLTYYYDVTNPLL